VETVLIQINNIKAYRLLEDLEDLAIITELQKDRKPDSAQKLSEKYAGKLPADVATELQEYVTKSRSEWDRNGI